MVSFLPSIPNVLIQGARVHYGLDGALATEDD